MPRNHRLYFCLIALLLAASHACAFGQSVASTSWDFSADIKGWQVWGTPKSPTPEQQRELQRCVILEREEGHGAKGALKVMDPSADMGPYALGPVLALASDQNYTLKGWIKAEKATQPDIFVMLVDDAGNLKSVIGSTGTAAQTSIGSADEKGWRPFELTVQAQFIPSGSSARIGIRPGPDYGSRDAFTGAVWVDDVTWESKLVVVITGVSKESWAEFIPSIRPTRSDAVSLEFLLDAPAGKHGHVQIKDGHFVFADGTPVRFWGTNIHAASGLFPTHDEAELVAATLARYGCNIVRLHLTETMLIDRTREDRQTFIREDQWEPFDYLVKCLKDKGIYILLDSITGLSSRDFQDADGIHHAKVYNQHKSWVYHEERFQELARSYMKGLLAHKNRYTGFTLATEPAIAMMLLINEQTAFFDWGIKEQPPYYKELMQTRFNEWLLSQYKTREKLDLAWRLPDGTSALHADEDPARGTVTMPVTWFGNNGDKLAPAILPATAAAERLRYRAVIDFLQDMQVAFSNRLSADARALGVKVPIIATNFLCDLAEVQAMLPSGITSQNAYWDHVQKVNGVSRMRNIPEVATNLLRRTWSTESQIAATKIAGCPATSTENDAMWPHEWRSSHLMMTAANAALQNHDAIFQYAFGGGWAYTWSQMRQANTIMQPTVEFNDPAMLASFVAGSLLYLRGDVKTSSTLIRMEVDDNLSYASQDGAHKGCFPTNYIPFVCRFENHFVNSQPTPALPAAKVLHDRGDASADDGEARARALDAELKKTGKIPQDVGLIGTSLISETRELTRDWGRGIFLVNTPRSQGFTGFPSTDPILLKDVSIQCQSPFATIQLSALNGRSLADASRILLICAARADNQGAKVSYASKEPVPQGERGVTMTLHDPGTGPVVIEPVRATVTLRGSSVRLTQLGPDMAPVAGGSRDFLSEADGKVAVDLAQVGASVWYLLERTDTK